MKTALKYHNISAWVPSTSTSIAFLAGIMLVPGFSVIADEYTYISIILPLLILAGIICLTKYGNRMGLVIITLSLCTLQMSGCAILGLAILFTVVDDAVSAKESALLSFVFGLGLFIPGLYWISIALTTEIATLFFLIPFSLLALPALLSVYFAIFGYACFYTKRIWYLWPLLFALIEYMRASLLTGFPWLSAGYLSIASKELMQLSFLTGNIYGQSLIILYLALMIFALYKEKNHARALALMNLASVSLALLYGYMHINYSTLEENKVSVRIVQANISPLAKWSQEAFSDHFKKHIELSCKSPLEAQYVIWPETSFPFDINQVFIREWMAGCLEKDQNFVIGTIRTDGTKLYNSIVLFNKSGEILDTYDKIHLVPFGEYQPFKFLHKLVGLSPDTFGELHPGITQKIISANSDHSYGFSPIICYEAIFNSLEYSASTWILNLTNDGWYGNSIGPLQHLNMARFRAIEHGKPLVRAANTGVSAIVDSFGRVTRRLNLMTTGVINDTIPGYIIKSR